MNILERLVASIRGAATFNPEVMTAPACILWPDHERQFATSIPALMEVMPELVMYGSYAPTHRSGPAIWLRCVVAGLSKDVPRPQEHVPVIYLPGISRQDLRAVESCPDELKPLAELQYRGAMWSQINGKDWTILALLKSEQGGLGLDVAQDADAKQAMQGAFSKLLEEDETLLRGKRLDKDFFNAMLSGGDLLRDILQWMDHENGFQADRGPEGWRAFTEISKSKLGFNPQQEGVLAACVKLAEHEGPWQAVWDRFCEAPHRYPNIPDRIRTCNPPSNTMFWHSGEEIFEGWPQWNEDQESVLRQELLSLLQKTPKQARSRVLELEKTHGKRRSLVWADLNEAPLAMAIRYLAIAADKSATGTAAGSFLELAEAYIQHGWQVDDAVLRAASQVQSSVDVDAVSAAIRAIYLPWAEEAAKQLQVLSDEKPYPGTKLGSRFVPVATGSESGVPKKGKNVGEPIVTYEAGECILFVDGLRFDVGKRLAMQLEAGRCDVTQQACWAALPTVTATGKASVSPVGNLITGVLDTTDFEPVVAESGQSIRGGYHFKKLLGESGWPPIGQADKVTETGRAWHEVGNIDHEGHDKGWKLAKAIDHLVMEIRERILDLLDAGWNRVRVVTDHGWLLMPGGLPKVNLPSELTDSKWGRCAAVKPGAKTMERLFPWYWNPEQYFALADGASCYLANQEYAHGGLSLQECLLPQLIVTRGKSTASIPKAVVVDAVWKGLRCTVEVEGACEGIRLDIRKQAGNASTSVVLSMKTVKENGATSVVVEDEDLEGDDAFIVLLTADNQLISQRPTKIGGGSTS